MFYIPRRDLETPATNKVFEWCDLKLFRTFLIWNAGPKINETTGDPSGGGVESRAFDLFFIIII